VLWSFVHLVVRNLFALVSHTKHIRGSRARAREAHGLTGSGPRTTRCKALSAGGGPIGALLSENRPSF
jgi:hypothetical protein